MMNHFIRILLIAVAAVSAIPSFAVTQQEMEKARAMAAKHYLRYANNGSDYLDQLNPSNMSELTKELKTKEKENIKSFNAVSVPGDYASWDKAKLVEYWSKTFFKSPGLKEDGKKCLSILAKNLGKIEVKAPSQTPDKQIAKPEEPAKPQADAQAQSPANETSTAETPTTAEAADPVPSEEETLAAQSAADQPEIEEEHPRKSSGTMWYVAILVILVGVVVWLVMYAQKSMKETGLAMEQHKNGENEIREVKKNAKEEVNKIREQYAASIAAKNEELKQIREKFEALETQNEELRRQLAHLQKATPNQPATDTHQPTPTLPPVVYLGYVNQRGLFVKASRSLNAESSVYRMDIPDGTHGSFKVVNDPSVLDRLLSDPAQWLEGGCDIENPQDADIATEILNVEPGQAVFADNSCRVVKKARIKFI